MLTKKDYSEITVDKIYLVEYEFCDEKHTEIMDGDVLLEIENGGYDVINYRPLTKLDKKAAYLIKVPEDMDFQSVAELDKYLEERCGIKCIIVPECVSVNELPIMSSQELFEYIKNEIGIKE